MEDILKFKAEVYESEYKDIPVFDSHTHVMRGIKGIEQLVQLKDMFGFKWMNTLSVSGMGDITQNPLCMLLKVLHPEKNYIFGGLLHEKEVLKEGYDYLKQAKNLIALGFDGMKMIEGKPGTRKKLNKPMDDPSYDEYYRFLEEEKIPVLLHIADPETFWDREAIPEWAYNNGWFYDDSYTAKEELYNEVERLLTKFPKLHAIFAHFYFLSANLERASEFLDKWENVSIDLTPGTEMYVNFAKQPERWREFFIKYQDKIIFGTDVCDYGSKIELENMIKTVKITRMFLETDKEYQVWDLKLKGIGLDKEVLEKIYYRNFLNYVGDTARKLNVKGAIEESKRTIDFAVKASAEESAIRELEEILAKLNEL